MMMMMMMINNLTDDNSQLSSITVFDLAFDLLLILGLLQNCVTDTIKKPTTAFQVVLCNAMIIGLASQYYVQYKNDGFDSFGKCGFSRSKWGGYSIESFDHCSFVGPITRIYPISRARSESFMIDDVNRQSKSHRYITTSKCFCF